MKCYYFMSFEKSELKFKETEFSFESTQIDKSTEARSAERFHIEKLLAQK